MTTNTKVNDTLTTEQQQTEQNTYAAIRKETIKANKPQHTHKWVFYDGTLGYESFVCKICGIDQNDLRNKLTLEQLSNLHIKN